MGDTCFIFLLTYNSLVDDGGVVRYKYFMLFVNILRRVSCATAYSRPESEKLLHLPGKNYNKLKVLTGYKG